MGYHLTNRSSLLFSGLPCIYRYLALNLIAKIEKKNCKSCKHLLNFVDIRRIFQETLLLKVSKAGGRVSTRNTEGGSITVLLTSCLTGLDQSVLQIKTKIVCCHTANSKLVKQEVNGTVILPPLVFSGCLLLYPREPLCTQGLRVGRILITFKLCIKKYELTLKNNV